MKILAWGANSYGQLGLGYKCEQILTPTAVNFLPTNNIVSISGGAGHSIILDEDGALYSCGWNTKGQLGIEEETLQFKKISKLENHKIVQVSCGWDFNAAVTNEGKLFVWGSNAFLQLGLAKSVKFTATPILVEGLDVKFVSCGVRHMAIVTKNGELYVCGSGNKGQLGIVDETGKIFRETDLKCVPGIKDLISVACGQHHTLTLTSDGIVYVWGDNKHGQLGLNPVLFDKILTPHKLDLNLEVKDILTGWTHSAIFTKNGEIYNFGRNSYGQLGKDREFNWQPMKLECKSLKYVTLASEHNLAVTSDGKLLCWGWNEHGNCGTGDTEDVKSPTEILLDYNTLNVATGTGQSFAVVLC